MPKPILDISTLKHIATLARIKLDKSELNIFQKQITEVLDHINRLSKVDTVNTKPTFQTTSSKTTFVKRKQSHLDQSLALSSFKKTYQGFLVVPPSIEK